MRGLFSLGAFFVASAIATSAYADAPPKPRSTSLTPGSEAGLGMSIMIGGYAYAATMGGLVYEDVDTRHRLNRAFIPFAGPILGLMKIDPQTMLGGRLTRDVDCPGPHCLFAVLGGLTVLGIEAALLVGSAAAQVTGAAMTVHGLTRMGAANATTTASLRPRVSVMPALGPNMAGASLTVIGF